MCNCHGKGFVMWTNGGTFGARPCSCVRLTDAEAMALLLKTLDSNRQAAKAMHESAKTGQTVIYSGYRVKVTKIRRRSNGYQFHQRS